MRLRPLGAALALLPGCTLLLDFDGELATDAGVAVIDAPPGPPPDAGLGPEALFEPNEGFAEAAAIEINTRYDHIAVAPIGDRDFYAFSLAEEREVVIDCRFKMAMGDLDMKLYDASMAMVAASETFADDEQIIRTQTVGGPLPAGDYFIEVYGYMNLRANRDYRLIVNVP